MTIWPQPARKDLDTFCRTEGWRQVRTSTGRTGTHHVTCELVLPDGAGILRTRISHPPDRTDTGAALWAHTLRDQLQVSAEAFWACVQNGVRPDRGGPALVPAGAVPADLVHLLIHRVGLPEAEVADMSKAGAIARAQRYWTDSS